VAFEIGVDPEVVVVCRVDDGLFGAAVGAATAAMTLGEL